MGGWERWGLRDTRTMQRMGMSVVRTREQAERELAGYLARDARGGRPDLHEYWPHVEVYRLHDEDE